ncbi:hypothetical protein PZ897_14380 [Hoeflea sp. YIM 152468]|uniref:hypothetical protein n=1 Tax=Hoeflea sp. YIM 152468 TaxID=3031759 RepID=UPI0023DB73B8|nr:hypothetical protein [Hoeflea sp. YIM 152468]MDF1609368.1 hypothetical protein [Hoeflea sp. YIM 152468]
MDERFDMPEMSAVEIEGRLIAQRHVLQWLLLHVVKHDVDVGALLTELDERWSLADAQEDPGAVPTSGFAVFSATMAEMRLLLEPLKQSRTSMASQPATGQSARG